jgi:hypothetical protein
MTSAATALADGPNAFTAVGLVAEKAWNPSGEAIMPTDLVALFVQLGRGVGALGASSATRIRDPWITFEHSRTTNGQTQQDHLLISDLGWSLQEAAEVRLRLLPFEEDWNAPEMDAYDAL